MKCVESCLSIELFMTVLHPLSRSADHLPFLLVTKHGERNCLSAVKTASIPILSAEKEYFDRSQTLWAAHTRDYDDAFER